MNINSFSRLINVFKERTVPEEGYLVGYGALHKAFILQTPLPDNLASCETEKK
jgi:hypothetical protein